MKGLGKRIRFLRKDRRLTLVQIAKATGIDMASLSRMENELMTGTIESHLKIAEAMGLTLPDLYSELSQKRIEAKDKQAKQKFEQFTHSSGAVAELLTSAILQKKMLPVLLKIKPGGRTENEEYPAAAERFIYILKGTLQARAGKEKRLLKENESLYFNASLPHHFENVSKTECWCLSVMTPVSL